MSAHHARLDARRWRAVRRAVFERDRWRCVKCGRFGRLECDHIRPLASDPGQDPFALDGLQSLCRSCHISKTRGERRASLPPERKAWADYLARDPCKNRANPLYSAESKPKRRVRP